MKVVKEKQPKKKRKKKEFCYCEEPYDKKKPMVECVGKTKSCKNGWYHIRCLEKKEKRKLDRIANGGVEGDVICALCQVIKRK